MSADHTDPPPKVVKRHRLSTRAWHWLNVVAVFTLLMSGLTIFNAHPRLYWGQYGANPDAPWLHIGATRGGEGFLRVGGIEIETTGVLGVWEKDGQTRSRAFPHWATLPANYSLAAGRKYHFLGAWLLIVGGVLYLIWSLLNRHVWRDLLPKRGELSPPHLWQDVKDHARLRLPRGEAAARYNVLQKLAYLLVLFVLLPAMVLTGLGMSPTMNASWGWILDLFGGRQSARSVHFIAGLGIVLFIVVHLIMVVIAGPVNEVRSMITGRFRLPAERKAPAEEAA
ncbi:cytochrome b/b6 domain-containing protein [Croceicoccus naphthovorans]|uniref:HupC n=1 Tax=Croceicoccus naphthovorans TaxID=1348774 RepID=A0A0G3XHX5_9SPHN|nr:cytochrome b/b6 domain-containing protein [Croceicoccus naphthovorans]AKM10216.1 HupC [Croceicoccus naphthovorans]MBB3990531.1 thiosulfate reductase cytochrome b subunit [Croceicoccus naphthovorans]